ncbi:MAG: hypothetical protein HY806_03550 [Nitrospirae bacterium]|nr:hypothetical protein [Nitrospirota bacterium]
MADNTGQRNSPEKKPGREFFRLLATASTVGINLVLSTFIGFALGYYLVLGILIGGLFGLLNLRGLARSVSGLIGTEKAAAKIVFLNMLRLSLLFSAIFILVYFKIVNVFGLLFGFTVVFVLILVEGLRQGKI